MAENRLDFQRLARMRLADARVLIRHGNFEGAYYLTGMAVECALKACIARNTKRNDFPPNLDAIRDIYTHDLVKLIRAAKLQTELDIDRRRNASLDNKWALVIQDWRVSSRYAIGGLNARDLYRAVAGRNGVMQWLRQRW
jgi:HEPN domain-containing protein